MNDLPKYLPSHDCETHKVTSQSILLNLSFTGFPQSLNGQSHFLLPLSVTSKSCLYCLYLPYLSQPNKTYVFLPYYPFAVSDLNITIKHNTQSFLSTSTNNLEKQILG